MVLRSDGLCFEAVIVPLKSGHA